MPQVSLLRLYLLRAMYLFMATGLALTVWPSILSPPNPLANANSVVHAILGALGLLFALGIRYPLKMLPILIFELLWKLIWVLGSALPMYLSVGLDAYASESLAECLIGVVLCPLVIPWGFVTAHYVRAKGDPWRN